MKEYIIEKLTELLIKQEFEDREREKVTYVRKTRAYFDLIQLLKRLEKGDV